MDENLLREIIARIMSDPRLQPLLANAEAKTMQKKSNTLIVIETEAGLSALPELQRSRSHTANLSLCLVGPVSHPAATLPQVSCEQAIQGSSWEQILIPECSVQQLGEIVMGFRRDKLTDLVAWALLLGIPLEIGRVAYNFTDHTPAAYRRRLESYAKQAAAYGIKIGDMLTTAPPDTSPSSLPTSTASLPWSFGEQVNSVEPESRSSISFDKKLMTEKEVLLFPEHAILMLSRSTVLTPSAIDLLKRQKIQVYKEGVRYL